MRRRVRQGAKYSPQAKYPLRGVEKYHKILYNDRFGDDHTFVFLADHGGHDRTHGTESPEDMTIPLFFFGKPFAKGKVLEEASIKDVAPTIAKLMEVEPAEEWEGTPRV